MLTIKFKDLKRSFLCRFCLPNAEDASAILLLASSDVLGACDPKENKTINFLHCYPCLSQCYQQVQDPKPCVWYWHLSLIPFCKCIFQFSCRYFEIKVSYVSEHIAYREIRDFIHEQKSIEQNWR